MSPYVVAWQAVTFNGIESGRGISTAGRANEHPVRCKTRTVADGLSYVGAVVSASRFVICLKWKYGSRCVSHWGKILGSILRHAGFLLVTVLAIEVLGNLTMCIRKPR